MLLQDIRKFVGDGDIQRSVPAAGEDCKRSRFLGAHCADINGGGMDPAFAGDGSMEQIRTLSKVFDI